MITKDLLYNNTYNWYKSLPRLIENYNNTYQSTIRDTPNNVDITTDPDKLIEIKRRIYNNVISKRNSLTTSKYKVGDIVRIKMYNDKTRQNWSDELYKIQKVHKSRKIYSVPYYYISSINNNKIIDKKYYDNDLQYIPDKIENKVEKVEKFEISKILDFKRKNGKDHYLIKWKGYKQPSLEPYDILIIDIPKMIIKYDKEHDITH